MGYRTDNIPNIRTIKALRGDSLKIDLGKEFPGVLTCWMKRKPNDLEYRSFEVQDGRYLYLSKEKTSDYVVGSEVVSAIEGKWYFDVEQDLGVGTDSITIFRGTIMFHNDITGSQGSEGVAPPDSSYRTVDIKIISNNESVSGNAVTQYGANIEFTTEISTIKGSLNLSSAYKFDEVIDGDPENGYLTLDKNSFTASAFVNIAKLDSSGFDNSYFIEALAIDDFLTFTASSGTSTVAYKVSGTPILDLSGDFYRIPVIHESSIGTIFNDQANISIDGLNKGASANLTEEIIVAGVGQVGAVVDGEVFAQGTSFTESWKRLLQKTIPPTYTPPVVSLAINPSSTQEIGDVLSITLTPTFTKNDGGNYTSVSFKKGGTTIRTQTNLTPYVHHGQITQAGANEYTVEISYSEGPIKNDNFGNPNSDGRIPAGTGIGTNSFSGSYNNWFGPNGNSEPNNGLEIRDLNNSFSNSFTLNTGNTALIHVIAIPSTKNLVSVIDVDALSANITANYILSGTLNSVPDGGGNNIPYKVYILSIASAYSANHRHNIIIS